MQMALEVRSRSILRFGVFEVDVRSGELRKQGVRIKLQEQPFHVLAVLLQRPGEVVTREELRSQNWPADTFVDFDNSLNTAVNKLREALLDSADCEPNRQGPRVACGCSCVACCRIPRPCVLGDFVLR